MEKRFKMAIKTIRQLPLKERKKLREGLEKLKELNKGKKDLLIELFIKPIDDRIKLIDDTLKGNSTIERFKMVNEQITKYIEEVEVLKWKRTIRGGKNEKIYR